MFRATDFLQNILPNSAGERATEWVSESVIRISLPIHIYKIGTIALNTVTMLIKLSKKKNVITKRLTPPIQIPITNRILLTFIFIVSEIFHRNAKTLQ
jgi:hypothetical protein